MNKSDLDNFHFTKRWMSEHLPSDMNITTEILYNSFTDRLNALEVDKAEMPSKSAFTSRLHKMDFLKSKRVFEHNCKGKKVWQTSWSKVEIVKEVEEVVELEPCVFSKLYERSMKLIARSRERRTWWK